MKFAHFFFLCAAVLIGLRSAEGDHHAIELIF